MGVVNPTDLPHANCSLRTRDQVPHLAHTHYLRHDRDTRLFAWCEGYGNPEDIVEPVAEFQASGLTVRVDPSLNVLLVVGHGEHELLHLVPDVEGLRTALSAAKVARDKVAESGG